VAKTGWAQDEPIETCRVSSTELTARVRWRARERRSWRPPRPGPLLRHAVILLFVGIILLPIAWVALMSISDGRAIVRSVLWPGAFDASSYGSMLRLGDALRGNVLNSVLVTAATVVLTSLCAVLAGYALTHLRTPRRGWVVALLVASLFVPTKIVAVVAIWQVHRALGLLNEAWVLVLPYTGLSLALGVLIMRAVFQGVSHELAEAAALDGAGPLRTLLWVLLPVVRNGVLLVLIATFVFAWGEYLLAARLIDDRSARTLPLVLGGGGGIVQPRSAALWMVSALPALGIAVIAQRFVTRGIQEGLHR
jgi:ABC-type glycerol-3-phosphate transport system permease component